ncbi:uncharacterized protein LOC131155395 [Malania oleifera]|uniref:uncharacterized protein LOC131155395 n=1 Tax=Malania oleifera TaxID=397392 RepID=UPI0025AE39D9|nr:uncharacterized protein LOC131155395 [Malania oleifera]
MPMNPVEYTVVDAFTDSAFQGNPAAICFLEEERGDDWLLAVAREFNVSETCYLTRITDSESQTGDSPDCILNPRFRLRWFTPVTEVNLCGHGTLAAAYTIFTSGLVNSNKIEFLTLSGVLSAKRVLEIRKCDASNCQNGEKQEHFSIQLDFPVVPIIEYDSAEVLSVYKALNGASVIDIKKTTADDLLVELSSGKAVVDFQPQFDDIERCPGRGLIITGFAPPDSGFDFFSRFFCPKYGVREDPVCGSAHCALATYWCKKLGKCNFIAYAASPRSGILYLNFDKKNQRVLLRGKAVAVMKGSVLV